MNINFKKSKFLYVLAAGIYFCSCTNISIESTHDTIAEDSAKQTPKASIIIQPFEQFPPQLVNLVAIEVKKIYVGSVTTNAPIPFPENALNKERQRYRADSLIKYLSKLPANGELIIGLTNKDISMTKGKNPDFGIFGLGYCPGNACVASIFRLKGKNQPEKLFKVAIHELAHTQGLNHCPEKNCFMRDAKGKDHLDEETGFCSKCKKFLRERGWRFK